MHPRTQLVTLAERLYHWPNKTRTHLIKGATDILKILSNNEEGNTFLRIQEDKHYLDIIIFYLKPFAKILNIGAGKKALIQHPGIEFGCITHIRPSIFKQLSDLLETEQLVEEVTNRVGNSYQRVIIGLQLENQRLSNLLKEQKPAVNDVKSQEPARPTPPEIKSTLSPMSKEEENDYSDNEDEEEQPEEKISGPRLSVKRK